MIDEGVEVVAVLSGLVGVVSELLADFICWFADRDVEIMAIDFYGFFCALAIDDAGAGLFFDELYRRGGYGVSDS